MRKKWSAEEDDFLRYALLQGFSVEDMEEALDDRTKIAIRNRISILGLRKEVVAREKDGLIRCSACKQYKEKDDFIQLKDGKYYSYCNDCKKEINRKRYLKKKEENLLMFSNDGRKTKLEVNNNEPLRVCSKCKVAKAVDCFYWDVDGVKLSSMCKDCRNKINKAYQEKRLRTKGY